jgi:hypothetical protein
MAIPNLPSLHQKIGKGREGGHEFARLMNLLMKAEGKELGYKVIISSDSAGDYKGVDCILEQRIPYHSEHRFTGFQYKFCASPLNNTTKSSIKQSLKKAIKNFPKMSRWVLVVPEDFNKYDMAWFTSLAKEHTYIMSMEESFELFNKKKETDKVEFDVYAMGYTGILEMILKHSHIGKKYYPELFDHFEGKLTLNKISVNTKRTNWMGSPSDIHLFSLRTFYDKSKKSNELVFDFQFSNNTPQTYLLSQINILIKKVWTRLKGLDPELILLSSGEIEYEINFKKKVNTIKLENHIGGPIIFKPNKPLRFGLHLLNFTSKCPGNMAMLQFEFIFDSKKLKSELITLDF